MGMQPLKDIDDRSYGDLCDSIQLTDPYAVCHKTVKGRVLPCLAVEIVYRCDGNEEIVHFLSEDPAENVKILDVREAAAVAPLVDGLDGKSHPCANLPVAQATLVDELSDSVAGGWYIETDKTNV